MLVDSRGTVIAASDNQGVLTERIRLRTEGQAMGSYEDREQTVTGFALTPGYETSPGPRLDTASSREAEQVLAGAPAAGRRSGARPA